MPVFFLQLILTGRHSATYNDTTQNLTDGSQDKSPDVFNTTSSAGVTLGLTIFNGFNVQTTYKKLNELKQMGELNTQLTIENLIADIVSGYYNYIQQIQLLNNLKYAVTLSKERLRIDEDRYLAWFKLKTAGSAVAGISKFRQFKAFTAG